MHQIKKLESKQTYNTKTNFQSEEDGTAGPNTVSNFEGGLTPAV